MRPIIVLGILILFSCTAQAQFKETASKSGDESSATNSKKELTKDAAADPAPVPLKDSRQFDQYGDLLNDDPYYNRRSPITVPLFKVFMSNVQIWAIDRYILNYDYSRI